MTKPATSWKRLYETAMAEQQPSRLKRHHRAAECAMTAAAQDMLNGEGTALDYEELSSAMRKLYEHALRKGVNIPSGTFGGTNKKSAS